jgi:hypothetical protein
MIVAMVAVGVMKMPLVVRAAAVVGCAPVGISLRYFNLMFIDVIAVHMVQMPIMQVINVASVVDGRVTTIGSMNV